MVAERHRVFIGYLLPFTFCSRIGIWAVYSHLLLFTKHNLSKILSILDINHDNLSINIFSKNKYEGLLSIEVKFYKKPMVKDVDDAVKKSYEFIMGLLNS